MRFVSLFAGIGGLDLGLERVGMECVAQVEIDDYCQKILSKHWANVPKYKDVRDVGKDNLPTTDLICGGFPCQPFSVAGKRGGKEDDRYLWPEMFRIIQETRPTWIIGENVAGIVNVALDTVCLDLESEGYEVQPIIIPACSVNAPHRRDRVWIVGHAKSAGTTTQREVFTGRTRNQESADTIGIDKQTKSDSHDRPPTQGSDSHASDTESGKRLSGYKNESIFPGGKTRKEHSGSVVDAPNPNGQGSQKREVQPSHSRKQQSAIIGSPWDENWLEVATRLCRVDDGLPRQVDRVNRLKALGNAIVPQVAYQIMEAIKETI